MPFSLQLISSEPSPASVPLRMLWEQKKERQSNKSELTGALKITLAMVNVVSC